MQIRISYFQKLVTYEGESTMKVGYAPPSSSSAAGSSLLMIHALQP